MAELDEEAVGLAWMYPREVRAGAIDLRAGSAELGNRARDVGALEADEIDALATARQEPAGCLGRVGRLQQLDVSRPQWQDRVAKAEVFGFAPVVLAQPEQPRVAGRRRIEIVDDDGQLDDVPQHKSSSQDIGVKRPSIFGEIVPLETIASSTTSASWGPATASTSTRASRS